MTATQFRALFRATITVQPGEDITGLRLSFNNRRAVAHRHRSIDHGLVGRNRDADHVRLNCRARVPHEDHHGIRDGCRARRQRQREDEFGILAHFRSGELDPVVAGRLPRERWARKLGPAVNCLCCSGTLRTIQRDRASLIHDQVGACVRTHGYTSRIDRLVTGRILGARLRTRILRMEAGNLVILRGRVGNATSLAQAAQKTQTAQGQPGRSAFRQSPASDLARPPTSVLVATPISPLVGCRPNTPAGSHARTSHLAEST